MARRKVLLRFARTPHVPASSPRAHDDRTSAELILDACDEQCASRFRFRQPGENTSHVLGRITRKVFSYRYRQINAQEVFDVRFAGSEADFDSQTLGPPYLVARIFPEICQYVVFALSQIKTQRSPRRACGLLHTIQCAVGSRWSNPFRRDFQIDDPLLLHRFRQLIRHGSP